MTSYSCIILCSARVIILVLTGSFSGCTTSQSAATATPTTLALSGGSNAIAIKNFAF